MSTYSIEANAEDGFRVRVTDARPALRSEYRLRSIVPAPAPGPRCPDRPGRRVSGASSRSLETVPGSHPAVPRCLRRSLSSPPGRRDTPCPRAPGSAIMYFTNTVGKWEKRLVEAL